MVITHLDMRYPATAFQSTPSGIITPVIVGNTFSCNVIFNFKIIYYC